jgi:hypothetical protein
MRITCEKSNVNDDLKNFFKDGPMEIGDVQYYNPIYDNYYEWGNKTPSNKDITVSSKYKLVSIESDSITEESHDRYSHNSKSYTATIYNSKAKKTFQKKVFFKVNSILGVTEYMMGKYHDNPRPFLPDQSDRSNELHAKKQCKNNGAYTDSFCTYVLSRLPEAGLCPAFPIYYGNFCGLAEMFHADISEEYDSYKNTSWYNKGVRAGKFSVRELTDDTDIESGEYSEEELVDLSMNKRSRDRSRLSKVIQESEDRIRENEGVLEGIDCKIDIFGIEPEKKDKNFVKKSSVNTSDLLDLKKMSKLLESLVNGAAKSGDSETASGETASGETDSGETDVSETGDDDDDNNSIEQLLGKRVESFESDDDKKKEILFNTKTIPRERIRERKERRRLKKEKQKEEKRKRRELEDEMLKELEFDSRSQQLNIESDDDKDDAKSQTSIPPAPPSDSDDTTTEESTESTEPTEPVLMETNLLNEIGDSLSVKSDCSILSNKKSKTNKDMEDDELEGNNILGEIQSELDSDMSEYTDLERTFFVEIPKIPVNVCAMEQQDGSLENLLEHYLRDEYIIIKNKIQYQIEKIVDEYHTLQDTGSLTEEAQKEIDQRLLSQYYFSKWRYRVFIKKMEREWASYLFQIIFALAVAQKHYNFTHNDLHSNNIMYKETKAKYLYYKFKGQYFKIPTYGKIMKIIDFGRAIYTVNGRRYFSDAFKYEAEAGEQYTYPSEDFMRNPVVHPNPSFDLCRLATSMIDDLYPFPPSTTNSKRKPKMLSKDSRYCDIEEGCPSIIHNKPQYETISPLYDMMHSWLVDKHRRNVMRYQDFELYKMIAQRVHNALPMNQLLKPVFKQFRIAGKYIDKRNWVYVY